MAVCCGCKAGAPPLKLLFTHVNNTADAVAGMHVVERLVDFGQGLSVSNKLVDLQLAVHVVGNKAGQL